MLEGDWRERYQCPSDIRTDNCPLVEIPKEAKLIDANDLPLSSIDACDVGIYAYKYGMGILAYYKEDVDNAPTIFEEDKE